MRFSTSHLRTVFAEEGKFEAFRQLCSDVNEGNEIFEYDEDGKARKVSNKEANKAIRKVLMEVCDLTEEDLKSKKKRERALEMHHNELFEIIEEDVDFKVVTGIQNDEWFNDYVDSRNIALGDDDIFWTKEKVMLVVAEISGDHHDLTMQNLPAGAEHRVHTKTYGVKIGKDIDLLLLGRVDFSELTDKIAEAIAYKIREMVFTGVYGAAAQLPNNTQFVKTGVLSATTKPAFDTLIEDVATANNAEVVIMGTKTALKQINNVVAPGTGAVDWRSESQKEAVANTGRLGVYEGTELIEIPQRFALNDVTKKLISDDILLIFAKNEEKFVWFVDKGETQIYESGAQKGDHADDFQKYEVQREMGVQVQIPQYFGEWKFK